MLTDALKSLFITARVCNASWRARKPVYNFSKMVLCPLWCYWISYRVKSDTAMGFNRIICHFFVCFWTTLSVKGSGKSSINKWEIMKKKSPMNRGLSLSCSLFSNSPPLCLISSRTLILLLLRLLLSVSNEQTADGGELPPPPTPHIPVIPICVHGNTSPGSWESVDNRHGNSCRWGWDSWQGSRRQGEKQRIGEREGGMCVKKKKRRGMMKKRKQWLFIPAHPNRSVGL